MRRLMVALAFMSLTACQSNDLENQIDFAIAQYLARLCEVGSTLGPDMALWVLRTSKERTREWRQANVGWGPAPPDPPIPGLDEKTANGTGPFAIFKLYCECPPEATEDECPRPTREEWEWAVRNWVD